MKDFNEKTANIDGPGSGLGCSLALQLHEAGVRLALCYMDLVGIEETLRITGESCKRVSLRRVDVADRERMLQFAAEVLAHHGATRPIDQQCRHQSA